jgi:tetratricopeptide (TPR) repeat protein
MALNQGSACARGLTGCVSGKLDARREALLHKAALTRLSKPLANVRPSCDAFCALAALALALALRGDLAAAASPDVVFERAAESVVVIERLDRSGQRTSLGSGVVTGPRQVATSCHVLQGPASIHVRAGDKGAEATVSEPDPERDLCLLATPDLLVRPVRIVDVNALKVGQRVYAIGTPKGLERTLSEGLISSLRPRARSFVIQTSAAMSPGSSGGGLFDDEGRLVGISSFQYARGQNLNFAVPASWIEEIPRRARARWTRTAPAASVAHPLGARALALMDMADFDGALRVARDWVVTAPADALPRHMLGRALAGLHRSDEAGDAYRSALRIRPDLVHAWLDLGALYAQHDEHRQALEAFVSARERDARSVAAWIGSGRVLSALGRHDEAVEALQQAVVLDPTDPSGWDALAAAHVAQDRLDLAAAACRKALKLHPESPELWYRFGLVHAERADRIQAIQAQQEALRLKPGFLPALYELGELYVDQGEREKSREVYERLRQLDRNLAQTFREQVMH